HASVAEAEAQRLKDQTELARLEQLQPAGGAGGLAGASEQGIANRGNAANSAGYVSLSKTNLHELRLKPITEDFHLTEEAAAVLGMTAVEGSGVNQALEQLINRHNEPDRAKLPQIGSHLSAEPGRKTLFKVSAYPEEGQ